jgi:hypothetical protein
LLAQTLSEIPSDTLIYVSEPQTASALEVHLQKTVEESVKETFPNTPVMWRVAKCESGNRQFKDNGEVLRGAVNPLDVGVYQINEKYHLEAAKSLNLDIETLEGNLAYAKLLYEAQGTKPWLASKPCWSPSSEG